MKGFSKNIDMTQGPILKLVLLFALPICAGNMLQQLYSTVDTLVIGNFCSSVSLAAVGTSSQPVEMLLCIFLGLGTGVSILVSQYQGKGDRSGLNDIVATATAFLYICSLLVSILGVILGPWVLRLMQVPSEAWDYAVSYITIVLLGSLGNLGYNMNAGILRGLGDSVASLLFLMISCVVNIVLDLVFVAVFSMDVAGAALATTIAMFASWFFSIAYIKRKYPELTFTLIPRRMNPNMLLKIIEIGLPLGLNNSIYSVGHILLQALINTQGAVFMAGCSVAGKVIGLANVAINSLSSAATTFSGQNLGAEKYGRLKAGGVRIPLTSGIITCTAGLIVTWFSPEILKLFTRDAEVLAVGVTYVRVVLPFTWVYATFNGIICFVNGIGIIRYPTIVNILMLWAVRIPVAYLITRLISGSYLMACLPISFTFGLLCMLAFFRTKRWKEICTRAEAETTA